MKRHHLRRGRMCDQGSTAFVFRPGTSLTGAPLPGTVSKVFRHNEQHDFFSREMLAMDTLRGIVPAALVAPCLTEHCGPLSAEAYTAGFPARERAKCGHGGGTDHHQMVYVDCGPSLEAAWPPPQLPWTLRSSRTAPPAFLRTMASAMTALFQGIVAMHAAGMAHNDIKPANVLYRAETNTLTLIDYGLATFAGRNCWYRDGSTYMFHPPEFQVARQLREGGSPGDAAVLAPYAQLLRWLNCTCGGELAKDSSALLFRGTDFSVSSMACEIKWGNPAPGSSSDVYSAGILLLYVVLCLDVSTGICQEEDALATALTQLARHMMSGNTHTRPTPEYCACALQAAVLNT